jgi:hypothetical protein
VTDQTIGNLDGPPTLSHPAQSLTQPPPGAAEQLRRPARALLGWMAAEHGELLLAGQTGAAAPEAQRARVREARDAVAARPAGIEQASIVSALPAELAGHAARLEATPAGTGMRADGWEIALVDLGRVAAFQTHVFTDTATERVAGLEPGDLQSIAELTLPVNDTAPVSAQYDEFKQAYTITSPNPNFKVVGPVNGPLPDGTMAFGFKVTMAASFVQVARFQGRYVMRDGYHRAFGLLSRGITRVPAYVRDFDTTENLAPAGMMPQAAWLGDRPPLLRDYHDDRVAEPVSLPAQHRLIVIHALELLTLN